MSQGVALPPPPPSSSTVVLSHLIQNSKCTTGLSDLAHLWNLYVWQLVCRRVGFNNVVLMVIQAAVL